MLEANLGTVNYHKEVLEEATPEANNRQKSTANIRREEHSQQQERIKRTERAVPTAGRDVRGEQCLEERSWTDDEKLGY